MSYRFWGKPDLSVHQLFERGLNVGIIFICKIAEVNPIMNTKPTYYDLSQSQKILLYSQSFSLYKQINNVFSLMLLNKAFDFDALRQAIAIGYDQCDTMRLRMKHVKLKMKQYYLPSDPPDIGLLDFTGKSRQEIDAALNKEWQAYAYPGKSSPFC